MAALRDQKLLQLLGSRVKSLRTAKGLTQEELSHSANIEWSQVHRIEAGKTNLTFSTLAAVAKGLDISISELTKDL